MAGGSLASSKEGPLPLSSLNHISRNCANVQDSLDFYVNLLGFVPIKRPGFLNFDGAWLFNYGIGIHLLKEEEPAVHHDVSHEADTVINPRNDHISFQCDDINLVAKRLSEARIDYMRRVVVEGDIEVEQLFFHDPHGFMIEVCTCEKLPLEPIPGNPCSREFCQRLPSACHLPVHASIPF